MGKKKIKKKVVDDDDPMGKMVEDTITGLKGTVTGRAQYINGCRQVLIEPQVYEDGAYREIWIDEERVEVLPGVKPVKMTNGPGRVGAGSSPPARSGKRGG